MGDLSGLLRRLRRDCLYVLAGLPLALFSFGLLIPLAVLSASTLIIWVGALLFPLTLMIASGFAHLSRARLTVWGEHVPEPQYRSAGPGLMGVVYLMTDPRRWFDLAFETLVALPLRLVTFVLAVVWTAVAASGVTSWLWGWALPDDGGLAGLLTLGFPVAIPDSGTEVYLLDSGLNLVLGAGFLVTLPAVMRGLARLDAAACAALLGAETLKGPPGGRAQVSGRASTSAGSQVSDTRGKVEPETPRQGVFGSLRHRGDEAGFSAGAWSWIAVSYVAAVLAIIGWPVTAALYSVNAAVAMVVTIAHSASAVLAVRWSWAGLAASILAAAGTMAATAQAAGFLPWPWPVTALLTQCLVVLVMALRHRWYWAFSAWSAGAALTLAAPLLHPSGLRFEGLPGGTVSNGVVLVAVSGGILVLGVLIRLWTRSAGQVEQAETLSAAETRRRRELEEANRIARELHDVVAHSMSVINVQASTAKYRKQGLDPQVQQEFEDIAESSRQALGEMRALLAILRGDDAAPTAPVPGFEEITDLVEASRASGVRITCTGVHEVLETTEVSPTVGLTAYRVVQEALSNALRHAPGAAVDVAVSTEESGAEESGVEESSVGEWDRILLVDVVNAAAQSHDESSPGSGLGLAGLRERVGSLGGSVVASPRPDGGFVVSTRLPVVGVGEDVEGVEGVGDD